MKELVEKFINPKEDSSRSTAKAVGKNLGELFDVLDRLADTVTGEAREMIVKFNDDMRHGVKKVDGWTIKADGNNWKVTPPK